MTASKRTSGARRRRFLGLWLLGTLMIWAVAAGALVLEARNSAREAERALREISLTADLRSLDLNVARTQLASAEASLISSEDRLDHVVLAPVEVLPVMGRQLRSARSLTRSTRLVATDLHELVAFAADAQDQPGDLDQLDVVAEGAEHLRRLETTIDTADLGPSNNLVPALADARTDLAEQLAQLRTDVAQYRVIADGMTAFLSSDRYLLLGANNAEMRLMTGMHLSIGELEIDEGALSVPGLEATQKLFPVPGDTVVSDDVQRNWGFLALTNDYRKLGYSAAFDTFTGPQALEMWQAQTGERLDGVLMLDPFVLDAMLDIVGTVEIEGESYGRGAALQYLLTDQYSVFDRERRDERQDVLSDMANEIADRLADSSWDPLELFDVLRPLAEGRHIRVYSPDPVQQAAWRELGVDGSVDADDLGLFLLNTGASKLDPFMAVRVDADTTATSEGVRVDALVTIENRANDQLPQYVLGPWDSLEFDEAGTYGGRFGLVLPGDARSFSIRSASPDADELAVFGPDGANIVVATRLFRIPPGGTTTFRVSFETSDRESLDVLASTRFPATDWTWNGDSFRDDIDRTVQVSSS